MCLCISSGGFYPAIFFNAVAHTDTPSSFTHLCAQWLRLLLFPGTEESMMSEEDSPHHAPSPPQHIDLEEDQQIAALRLKVDALESELRFFRDASRSSVGCGLLPSSTGGGDPAVTQLQLHVLRERFAALARHSEESSSSSEKEIRGLKVELAQSKRQAADFYAEARSARAKNWALQHEFKVAAVLRGGCNGGDSWSFSREPSVLAEGIASLRISFCILCEHVWRRRIEEEAIRYLILRSVQCLVAASTAPPPPLPSPANRAVDTADGGGLPTTTASANVAAESHQTEEASMSLLRVVSSILDAFSSSASSSALHDGAANTRDEPLSRTSQRFHWWLARMHEETLVDEAIRTLLGTTCQQLASNEEGEEEDVTEGEGGDSLLSDVCIPPPFTRSIGTCTTVDGISSAEQLDTRHSVCTQTASTNIVELEHRAAALSSALDVEREANASAIRKLSKTLESEIARRQYVESEHEKLQQRASLLLIDSSSSSHRHHTSAKTSTPTRSDGQQHQIKVRGNLFHPPASAVTRRTATPPASSRWPTEPSSSSAAAAHHLVEADEASSLFDRLAEERDYVLRLEEIARQTPDAAMRQRLLRELRERHSMMLDKHNTAGVLLGARAALHSSPNHHAAPTMMQ